METPLSKRLPIGDPGYRSELQKALNYSIATGSMNSPPLDGTSGKRSRR
jgi:hypothetical protein